MNLKWLPVLLLLFSPATLANIYKWVDQHGTVHFSDQPQPGASLVPVDPKTLNDSPAATASEPAAAASDNTRQVPNQAEANPADKHPPVPATYKTLEIITPANQGTIRDNNGTIEIKVNVEPKLNEGDSLQVLLDGNPYGDKNNTTSLSITNVDRGEHKLAVQLEDKNGTVLKTSSTITIFLHRAFIKS